MNKELKTINIAVLNGDGMTAVDTAEDPQASIALSQFESKDQMDFKDSDARYVVPFHAVDHIEVEKNTATVPDRPDPYGCDVGGGTDGEPWFVGTVGPSQECVDGKYRDFYATSTDYADLGAITANPANYSIKINDIVLPYFRDNTSLNSLVWSNEENDEDVTASFSIVYGNIFGGTVPCDITGDIKIYVTKK